MRPQLIFLLGILALSGVARGAELALSPTDRLLILVPHPDDEVLCCGGLLQDALQKNLPTQIVVFTNGDNNAWAFSMYRHSLVFRPRSMLHMGRVRREETMAAAVVLGLPTDQILFLGYPDYGSLTLWNDYWDGIAYKSRMTCVQAVPYPSAYRPAAPYTGEAILHDLTSIVRDFRPTKIFIPHSGDLQSDHRALALFAQVALWDVAADVAPQTFTYVIHFPRWPSPRGLHKDLALNAPSLLNSSAIWLTFPLNASQIDAKYKALEKHQTQWVYSSHFLKSFVRRNELFEALPASPALPAGGAIQAARFENWRMSVDSNTFVLSGSLSPKLKTVAHVRFVFYGYRADTAFDKMPKIVVTFTHGISEMRDRGRPVIDPDMHAQLEGRRFSLWIPLQTLGQPEKILTSGGRVSGRASPNWDFWRTLDLPAASQP